MESDEDDGDNEIRDLLCGCTVSRDGILFVEIRRYRLQRPEKIKRKIIMLVEFVRVF